MLKVVNYLNFWWNYFVFWFHHASTRTNIRWLTSLSIWMFDYLRWELSEEWQLINGMPLKEYKLRYELELALHQARYFADYAYDLQCLIFFPEESEESEEVSEDKSKRKLQRV